MTTTRSIPLNMLAAITVLGGLYLAQSVLIPVVIAFFIYLLFAPLVTRLQRRGIPRSLSAILLIVIVFGGLGGAAYFLSEPAMNWLKEAPTNLRQVSSQASDFKEPLENIKEIEEEVVEITEVESSKPKTQTVEIKNPPLFAQVMKTIPVFLGSLLITMFTTFFMLTMGDRLSRKVMVLGRSWETKRRIILASREIQTQVSRHLRTITIINFMLGTVTGVVLWWMDVPNPTLWGSMVALFNFAPYVGALVSTVVLTLVGISSFPNLLEALAIPGIFIILTSFEGALITPLILGHRITLSPLVVFLSVILWGWLWGVAGALIAVPLMTVLKSALAQDDRTRPWSRLLEN